MNYTTTEQLIEQSGMTEKELLDHLVICSQKYLDWLHVSDPSSGIILDCTKHREVMARKE